MPNYFVNGKRVMAGDSSEAERIYKKKHPNSEIFDVSRDAPSRGVSRIAADMVKEKENVRKVG